MPPLVRRCCKRVLKYFSLTASFRFHSIALYTSKRDSELKVVATKETKASYRRLAFRGTDFERNSVSQKD